MTLPAVASDWILTPIYEISADDNIMLLPQSLPHTHPDARTSPAYSIYLSLQGRCIVKYESNPQLRLPIRPLHSEQSAILYQRFRFAKKAELLMFLIFLASLTYFWLWLETACPPVCEMQSCDAIVIWVIELHLMYNRKKGKKGACVLPGWLLNRKCHCLCDRLTTGSLVYFDPA